MTHREAVQKRILNDTRLTSELTLWRLKDERIVFTNGCFDLLHQGHLHLLMEAADMGTKLVVGLNSDNSVRRLKGDSRPIQDEQTRSAVLASLKFVAGVVIFDEDTPLELIKVITPDVLVKGGDWKKEDIVGADWVEAHGGSVTSVPYLDGFSTTNIEKRIQQPQQK